MFTFVTPYFLNKYSLNLFQINKTYIHGLMQIYDTECIC